MTEVVNLRFQELLYTDFLHCQEEIAKICHFIFEASLAYSKGISERQIMDWGGWEDFSTMHRFYVKLSAMDAEKNKNAVTDFFKSATAKPKKQNAN